MTQEQVQKYNKIFKEKGLDIELSTDTKMSQVTDPKQLAFADSWRRWKFEPLNKHWSEDGMGGLSKRPQYGCLTFSTYDSRMSVTRFELANGSKELLCHVLYSQETSWLDGSRRIEDSSGELWLTEKEIEEKIKAWQDARTLNIILCHDPTKDSQLRRDAMEIFIRDHGFDDFTTVVSDIMFDSLYHGEEAFDALEYWTQCAEEMGVPLETYENLHCAVANAVHFKNHDAPDERVNHFFEAEERVREGQKQDNDSKDFQFD